MNGSPPRYIGAMDEELSESFLERDPFFDENGFETPPYNSEASSGTEFAETLFHVKAKNDYHAQNDAQFSFRAGDIIAVTAAVDAETWWSGLLLDETRRHKWWEEIPLADVNKLPGHGLFSSDMVTLVSC